MSDEELDRAAAALAASPTDLGLWLQVATQLASGGHKAAAEQAFADLGVAASLVGQVALAVACARWLDERDAAAGAAQILDEVVGHARGGRRVDPEARPRPPGMTPAPPNPPEGADAVARALSASSTAAAAVASRAPDKLAPTTLVSALSPDDLRALVAVMRLVAVPADHVILDVGQPATALYWIARGTVAVSRNQTRLGELRANAFFGEIALLSGTPRTAEVTAVEDTWLLEIPAAAVEAAAVRQPELARVLAQHARARLLSTVVRTSELFSRLPEDDRASLLGRFQTQLLPAGTRFITQGSENEHLWVVVSGRCEVRDSDRVVATLGVGDGVGEMSLLARKPASADVVAVEPTAMLALARTDFEQVAVKYPTLLAEIYKLVVAREQANATLVHDAADLVV